MIDPQVSSIVSCLVCLAGGVRPQGGLQKLVERHNERLDLPPDVWSIGILADTLDRVGKAANRAGDLERADALLQKREAFGQGGRRRGHAGGRAGGGGGRLAIEAFQGVKDLNDYRCYSDDWRRTNPDLVLHLPTETPQSPEYVDHVLVEHTPDGSLLAIWTMAVTDRAHGVFFARSEDGGRTFTPAAMMDGPQGRPGQDCSFGFPVVSRAGRIYCFYNWSPGIGEGRINALLRCKYSDDDGRTWTDGGVEIPYRRSKFDHPDPNVLSRAIVWQKPIRDSKDRPIAGLTRTTAMELKPPSKENKLGECRCEFVRFDNIDTGPDPKDVELTFLPDDDELIWVPATFEPEASMGITFCQEPGLVTLPDGRLFTAMRTANGQVWYTVSDDDGHSWRPTDVLRFRDGGDPILNPVAPTPIFRFEDGRYLLFLQNHDGYGYGGRGPLDLDSRRPQFLAVGEYREGAHQPLWFSEPLLFCDTENVGVYPFYMKWLSMYASFTESDGERIFWYTDRKMFALGRYITDEMLAPLTVPTG